MSMPVKIIYCDSCDFQSANSVLWGDYQYKLGESRLWVNRTLGWCYRCGTIRPIEDLSNDDEKKERLLDLEKELLILNPPGLLNAIKPRAYDKRARIGELKEELFILRKRLSFLESRRSPPKCLQCSSENIQALNIPNADNEGCINYAFHPDCHGRLWMKDAGYGLAMSFRLRLYDPEGIFVGESDNY